MCRSADVQTLSATYSSAGANWPSGWRGLGKRKEARRIWSSARHGADAGEGGGEIIRSLALIHPTSENENSANFAFWAFSEVEPPLFGVR
jgi:hypothetical protein